MSINSNHTIQGNRVAPVGNGSRGKIVMRQSELIYSERRPQSDLLPWIQSLWTFDATALAASEYEHFVPPDGCISILSKRQVDPSRCFYIVVGPRCQPHQVPIQRGDCYDGVRFWPFAARALIGGKLPQLFGQMLRSPCALLICRKGSAQRSSNCQMERSRGVTRRFKLRWLTYCRGRQRSIRLSARQPPESRRNTPS
jgi:hypothetical protein